MNKTSFHFLDYLLFFPYILIRIIYYKIKIKKNNISDIIDRIRDKKNKYTFFYKKREWLTKVYLWTDRILRRLLKEKKPCLIRSMIIYETCIRNGIESNLVIGIRKDDQDLAGHAWIELDNEPFRENMHLTDYTEVLRY